MDRESAWGLVKEFAKSESLLKHCLSVEAVMRAYARKAGEDEEVWGIRGNAPRLRLGRLPNSGGAPPIRRPDSARARLPGEMIVRAILSHGNHTGDCQGRASWRRPSSPLTSFPVSSQRWLWSGPPRALRTPGARSVRRKMKDKAFARNVSRDDLVQGAEELGVDLDELIEFVADALKPVASELGLVAEGS